MNPDPSNQKRKKLALRKTEAEIRSLDEYVDSARRFWLDVGKFIIIVVPLAAGAISLSLVVKPFEGPWIAMSLIVVTRGLAGILYWLL